MKSFQAPSQGPSHFMDPSTPTLVLTLTFVAAAAAMSMNVFLPSRPGMALCLLVNAVLQIVVVPLFDWFGRRPMILYGFVIYIRASVGCIYAPKYYSFPMFPHTAGHRCRGHGAVACSRTRYGARRAGRVDDGLCN